MARITVLPNMKTLPTVGRGVLMIHKEEPPFVVMSTGPVSGDEFPGVALEDGAYGEQWIVDEFRVFEGTLTLEQ